MLGKTRSQFGLPKCVGARSEVIASLSAPTSCTKMLVMSSSLIFAVRYILISIRFCASCSSIACKSEWNHSAEPKSRMTQVKYTWKGVGEKAMRRMKRAHLRKTRRLGAIEVVHTIPNRLENPSGQTLDNIEPGKTILTRQKE